MNNDARNHSDTDSFTVRLADWQTEATPLSDVRRMVFIEEQNIPPHLEWDDLDAACVHAVALDAQGCAIGTARLLPNGHIGRIAVLKNWRRKGVGKELVNSLIVLNKLRGAQHTLLSAQLGAMSFYHTLGFVAEGEIYLDAEIPHQMMRLKHAA